MNIITIIILIFSVLGAIDWLIGNKIGIGAEFQRAFSLFAPMALSMLGMIVIAPAIGVWLSPFFDGFYNIFGIDPSVIPASLFANDMGGMTLAKTVCKSEQIGNFNAFIISSMMGCTISFNLPFALGMVKSEHYKELFFGFLCGIATVPIGCFISGLIVEIHPLTLVLSMLPLIIIALIVAMALIFIPRLCIKCFEILGVFMKILALSGLVISIFTFLTKVQINSHFESFENAALVCANACVTLSGALPFMLIVSRLLNKPLNTLGSRLGINGVSMLAFLGSMVTNASTFGIMEKMDKKGMVLNAAFAVSGSFVFGGHLAYTMVFDTGYVLPMIVGKLISGICGVLLALLIYKDRNESKMKNC